MRHCFVLALLPLFLIGCGATVPHYEVWRPWTRVLGDAQSIQVGQSIKIEVEGNTDPLLGEEELLQAQLASMLADLLSRRGFVIVDSEPDLVLTLKYRTERVEKFAASASIYARSYSRVSLGAGAGAASSRRAGLGVSAASAVADALTHSVSGGNLTMETKAGFIHTIELEFSSALEETVWKGESTWPTENVEMSDGVKTALRITLSQLPSDPSLIPAVPALKTTHVDNFLDFYCKDSSFNCPALPYRIYFLFRKPVRRESLGMPWYYNTQPGGTEGVGYLRDPMALPAYVDLAQTAEYAVPLGKKDYSHPLDLDLWKKVMLGGQYLLGSDKHNVRVLLQLEGKPEGYVVRRAWLASEAEFAEFETRLMRWQEALRAYFDMFEE